MGQGYEAGREGSVGAALWERLLAEIHADPERIGVVVFGRPYNAYDILPYRDEPLDPDYASYMHWEAGQRILRVARIVAQDPQLFGVYITNFLCAPDSSIVPFFRRVMGTKPSLTLELDSHTADAGIKTRIDAYLDIVWNHRAAGADDRAGRRSQGGIVQDVQTRKPLFCADPPRAGAPTATRWRHRGGHCLRPREQNAGHASFATCRSLSAFATNLLPRTRFASNSRVA